MQNPVDSGQWSYWLLAESRASGRAGDGVGSTDPARAQPARRRAGGQGIAGGTHEAHHRRRLSPTGTSCQREGRTCSSKNLGNGILSEGEFPQETSASSHADTAGNNPSKRSASAAHKRSRLSKGSLFPHIIHPARKKHPGFCLLKNTGQ